MVLVNGKTYEYRRQESKYICLQERDENLHHAHNYSKYNRRRGDGKILEHKYKA